MKIYKGLIPWGPQGPLNSIGYWVWSGKTPLTPGMHTDSSGKVLEWRENIPFKDEMIVTSYYNSSNSAGANLESLSTGMKFCMSIAEFFDHLENLDKKVMKGTFFFMKRGNVYLLEME